MKAPPPQPKHARRSLHLPETADIEIYALYKDDDIEYEEFNPKINFHKPIPLYLTEYFDVDADPECIGMIRHN